VEGAVPPVAQAVERESGRLKHEFRLVLRTRVLPKARLHADLVMLGRLSLALAQTRAA
jgi:hypothetical protein